MFGKEEQAASFEEMWAVMENDCFYKGSEMFELCFPGEKYESTNENHKKGYAAIWNFLNRKISAGLGFKSYIDGRKSTSFYKQEVGHLNKVEKAIVTWNQSIGKVLSKKELVNHVVTGWVIKADPAYLGSLFAALCEHGYGEKFPDGKRISYSIISEAPIDLGRTFLDSRSSKIKDFRAQNSVPVVEETSEIFDDYVIRLENLVKTQAAKIQELFNENEDLKSHKVVKRIDDDNLAAMENMVM